MVRQLRDREGTVIIFVKTKYGTEKMAKRLREDGFTADALHGDLRQRKRDQVMQAFRNKKFRILCATDIAARGLDVPHIEHVINHDLPQVADDYIHRMGRTARAGADGSALCFISPADNGKWREIERLLGIKSNDNGGEKRSNKLGNKKPFGQKNQRWAKDGAPKKKSWDDKPRFEKSADGETGEKRTFAKRKAYGDKPRFEKTADGGKPSNGGFKKKFGSKPNANKGKPNGNANGKAEFQARPKRSNFKNKKAA
jgi:superfamily II DNA/RNA helicase